jgi:hypothetical protein
LTCTPKKRNFAMTPDLAPYGFLSDVFPRDTPLGHAVWLGCRCFR